MPSRDVLMGQIGDHSIVKPNPLVWMLLLIVVIAIIVGAIIMWGLYRKPGGYHPAWAPSGCDVVMDHRYGNRIIVIARDEAQFDTEAECAQVILDVLAMEPDFFAEASAGIHGVPRCVELQLPAYGAFRHRFYIQYYEVRTDEFNFNVLRVIQGPTRYRNEDITLSQLREVANGELTLGFLRERDVPQDSTNP